MKRYRRDPKGSDRQPPSAQSGAESDANAETPKSNEGDAVGYRKPPKHSRFKPGQSGNPKGRPRGTRNFKSDVKSLLAIPVQVTRDGKRRKVSTQEAALLRIREKGLGAGDYKSLQCLLLLAQTHNNEEEVISAGLAPDDLSLVEVFTARLLSGATSQPESVTAPPADGRAPNSHTPPQSENESSGATPGQERYRLRNRKEAEK